MFAFLTKNKAMEWANVQHIPHASYAEFWDRTFWKMTIWKTKKEKGVLH
jgi:hypothetical protein